MKATLLAESVVIGSLLVSPVVVDDYLVRILAAEASQERCLRLETPFRVTAAP